jgi:hypothetical protein
MSANAFIGKAEQPTDEELAAELGAAKAVWDQLVSELAEHHEAAVREWNSYSRKAGWALRLKRQARTIVYLSPCRGCFVVSFALGDKALKAARESGLPPRVLKIIDEAKKYAEGTAVRLEVTGAKDIPIVRKLAAAKLA